MRGYKTKLDRIQRLLTSRRRETVDINTLAYRTWSSLQKSYSDDLQVECDWPEFKTRQEYNDFLVELLGDNSL